MKRFSFLNDRIVSLDDAKVSVKDIGLMRGYGLYEAIAVIEGKPLRLADHWRRFEDGAQALGLEVPVNSKEADKIIREIAEKSGVMKRANVRAILTGGETVGGIDYDRRHPTFYILVEDWSKLPEENYQKGAKLITFEYRREMPKVKTTNYIRAVSLQEKKKKEAALEILYTYDGKVLECATSNIFLVKNGVLITPNKEILEGVTRKIVLELAEENYKTEKREVALKELKGADEVFITASFKDIVPVVKVDEIKIGNGEVGLVTKDIMDRYAKYIADF